MLIYALLPVGLLFHSSLYVFLSLHTRSFDISADLLRFLLRYLPMATWFTVIGRIAQIEGIADSAYKNALVEFERAIQNFPRAAASTSLSGATFSKAAGTM